MTARSARRSARRFRRPLRPALRATALLIVVIAGGTPGAGWAGGSVVDAGAGCGAPYVFTEVPTNGTAPLLVRFSLAGPVSGTTPVSWSFGDGSWFNGTGNDYTFTVHSYLFAGNYTATVTVDPGAPQAICSGNVEVRRSGVGVVVHPATDQGVAPFTVEFSATVSGGTGQYLSETWSFGDGDAATGVSVNYTFDTPGRYSVLLVVADSAGSQGIGVSQVDVTSAPGGHPSGSAAAGASALLGWVLLGLGGVLFAAAALFVARAYRGRPIAGLTVLPPDGASMDPSPLEDLGPAGARAADRLRPARDPATVRSSQRVIAHLARQGAPPPPPVGLRSTTQAGIGEALGLEQSNLARILRRLEVAGLVASDLRHVPGSPRRVRAYSLTRAGESLSRALLRPSPRSAHDPGPPGPDS